MAFPDSHSSAAGLPNSLTVASLVGLLISLVTDAQQKLWKRYRDVASGIVGALYADGWRQSFESFQRLLNAVRRH